MKSQILVEYFSHVRQNRPPGGVGIAALNVALYYQCDVYVTVDTQEKRKFLKDNFPQIPESHIGNSRDTSFEEMIKLETKGRGVDIVLNSLSDKNSKLLTIRCLAKDGKLIEIGKVDLVNNTSLHLLSMEKEKSYHGVMLDRVYNGGNTKLKMELSNIFRDGLKLGYVKPLPRKIFKMDEIEAAFRYNNNNNNNKFYCVYSVQNPLYTRQII